MIKYLLTFFAILLMANINLMADGIVKFRGAYVNILDNTNFIVYDADIINDDDGALQGRITLNNNSLLWAEQSVFNYAEFIMLSGAQAEVRENFINETDAIVYIHPLSWLWVIGSVINSGSITNEHIIEIGQ